MRLFRWACLLSGFAVITGSSCPQTATNLPIGGENCADGASSYAAVLIGPTGQAGGMAYRASSVGCRECIVRVAGFAPGSYAVTAQTTVIGQITVGDDGRGQLTYDTQHGNFPANFPSLSIGDPADVGALAAGRFTAACPPVFEMCPGAR